MISHQRRWRPRAGAALVVVLLCGATTAVVIGTRQDALTERGQRTAEVPPATAQPRPEPGPSQSLQDAQRDGVPAAVAALPFSARVGLLAQEATTEGIWAVSRMQGAAGVLGDPTGRYGQDWVQGSGYGELLLLDAAGTRILRAVPLPGVPPQTLRVHDDAVYCARQGDRGLPDSMLCRADRSGNGSLVRVFADSGPDAATPVERPGWRRQPAPPEPVFSGVVACPEGLCVQGSGAPVPFHPTTLALPYDRAEAADTAEACRHIQKAFEADQRVDGPEWETVEAELYAAWRAGQAGSDTLFVRNLVAPGSLIDGDTQTLGDATHRLAGLCGSRRVRP